MIMIMINDDNVDDNDNVDDDDDDDCHFDDDVQYNGDYPLFNFISLLYIQINSSKSIINTTYNFILPINNKLNISYYEVNCCINLHQFYKNSEKW